MSGGLNADFSLFSVLASADIVVKISVLILLLASVWSWTIIFDKYITFKRVMRKTIKFEKVFWSGQMLDQLYDRLKSRVDHPMAAVFVAAMYEWNRQNVHEISGSMSYLTIGIKERIFQAMEVARSREMDKIEKNLSMLATIGSASPFIGLFGTVWGMMCSLQSIAAAKNATLAVVAPGISEALIATAIGLMAAIPAYIFYNVFSSKLNRFNGKIDDFSNELSALISRELDKDLN
jgi:biopolymer transport protein TolQ